MSALAQNVLGRIPQILYDNLRIVIPMTVTILTLQGTGADMWTGFQAQVAQAAQNAYPNVFYWQPVGNWPAAAFPMGPSVEAGVGGVSGC